MNSSVVDRVDPLVGGLLLVEGKPHVAGLLVLHEVVGQVVAAVELVDHGGDLGPRLGAQVREELLDLVDRLHLHLPLPRAQELGLLPAMDDAGGVLVELVDSEGEPTTIRREYDGTREFFTGAASRAAGAA